MRLAPVIVLVACAHPAPAPAPASRVVVKPCDEAAWRAMAESPLRARIGDAEVIVVEERAGESRDDTGDVVGIVTGTITGNPAVPGWLRVVFMVPWGRVTGYARVRPQDPVYTWPDDSG